MPRVLNAVMIVCGRRREFMGQSYTNWSQCHKFRRLPPSLPPSRKRKEARMDFKAKDSTCDRLNYVIMKNSHTEKERPDE